jgi:hypothetical protein
MSKHLLRGVMVVRLKVHGPAHDQPNGEGLDRCQLRSAETTPQLCPTRARDVPASHAGPRSEMRSPTLAATLIRDGVIFYGGIRHHRLPELGRDGVTFPSAKPR